MKSQARFYVQCAQFASCEKTIDMKQSQLLYLSIAYLVSLATVDAQYLEWRYDLDPTTKGRAYTIWLDQDQNICSNYRTYREDGSYRGKGLFKVDQNGQFKGIIEPNLCDSQQFVPFGKDQYLMETNYCDGYRSTLFDTKGNIVNPGEKLSLGKFATIIQPEGIYVFNRPLGNYENPYFNLTQVNWDFQIQESRIDLTPIQQGELGMTTAYVKPVRTENGTWILPIQYGERNGPGTSVDHGSLHGIRNGEVTWSYPDTLSHYTLEVMATHENKVAAIFKQTQNYRPKLFIMLDDQGRELGNFPFKQRGQIKAFALSEQYCFILTHFDLLKYDHDGNLHQKIKVYQDYGIQSKEMLMQDENTFIIVGHTDQGNGVMAKLKIEALPKNDVVIEEKEPTQTIPIAEASFEEVTEEALSVAAFPNPTSLFINFELKEGYELGDKFQIEIFSANGTLITKDEFPETRYELDVQSFLPGTYIFRIYSIDRRHQIFTGRFVKI